MSEKNKLAARLIGIMEDSLDTLKPPPDMPEAVGKFLATAARTQSTFTRALIRHFADTIAGELSKERESNA